MIKLILLAAVVFFGWMWFHKIGAADDVKKAAAKVDNEGTRYVENLQKDVKKAQDAADKAGAAIKESAEAVGKTVKDASGQ
jgi:hypothetical protein